jgi:UDP-glucose:(heptosyl)LPS alpha-1,3-glucosyltransferase
LIEMGIAVELYTRSHVSPRPGLHVHTINVSGPSRALKTAAFCRAVDKAITLRRPAVVHAISPSMTADLYQPRGGTVAETIRRNLALRSTPASRALKRVGQHLNLRQRMMLRMERRMLGVERGPTVIAISDYVVRQLRKHYQMHGDRIRKVFNGVDPDTSDAATRARDRREVRQLYGLTDRDVLVLMVAHNFRLKGLRPWMDALVMLSADESSPVKSIVVGKDDVIRWQRISERRGLKGRLQFAGPTQRIGAFYHAADVLVHPTYYDPCSRVVLEAMASGLACVTTRFDGASEVIDGGVNGLTVDDPDATLELAAAVKRLCDADFRNRIGAAAREVSDRFGMRRHADQIVELYREVAAKRSSE